MCAVEKLVTSHLLIALLHRGRDTTALNLSNGSTFFYHIGVIKASCTLTLKKLSLSTLRAPMGLLRSLKVAGLVRSAQNGVYRLCIARERNHFPGEKLLKYMIVHVFNEMRRKKEASKQGQINMYMSY